MEFCLSNEDVKLPKPSPEIYNLAIKKLGFSKNEVLIIEDNINGIKEIQEWSNWENKVCRAQ